MNQSNHPVDTMLSLTASCLTEPQAYEMYASGCRLSLVPGPCAHTVADSGEVLADGLDAQKAAEQEEERHAQQRRADHLADSTADKRQLPSTRGRVERWASGSTRPRLKVSGQAPCALPAKRHVNQMVNPHPSETVHCTYIVLNVGAVIQCIGTGVGIATPQRNEEGVA